MFVCGYVCHTVVAILAQGNRLGFPSSNFDEVEREGYESMSSALRQAARWEDSWLRVLGKDLALERPRSPSEWAI